MARDERSVESLVKARAVLDVLAAAGPCPIRMLSEQVGEPTSSTYRLLSSLMALGWVDRGAERGEYRLGVACVRIAGRIENRLDIQHVARTRFRAHREQSGVWSLHVLRQLKAVCIEAKAYEQVQNYTQMVGTSLPFGVGAASWVLYAYVSPQRFERLLDYHTRTGELGGRASSFRSEAMRRTERIRAAGFAYDSGETQAGVVTVSAPVFNHAGDLVAAVSLGALPRSLEPRLAAGDEPDEVGAVRAVAAEVSAGLGYAEDVTVEEVA